MTGLHESTLALSVYNAIVKLGAMNEEQILLALRAGWDPDVERSEVETAIRYLSKRHMVTDVESGVAPAQRYGAAPRAIIRHPQVPTELIFGSGVAVVHSWTVSR